MDNEPHADVIYLPFPTPPWTSRGRHNAKIYFMDESRSKAEIDEITERLRQPDNLPNDLSEEGNVLRQEFVDAARLRLTRHLGASAATPAKVMRLALQMQNDPNFHGI